MVVRDTQYEELRNRIARLRRRIDRSASRAVDRATGWVGWRSYVAQYPARALVAAVGAGFVLSTVTWRAGWPRRFGVWLYDLALQGAWGRIWDLLRRGTSRRTPAADTSGSEGESE